MIKSNIYIWNSKHNLTSMFSCAKYMTWLLCNSITSFPAPVCYNFISFHTLVYWGKPQLTNTHAGISKVENLTNYHRIVPKRSYSHHCFALYAQGGQKGSTIPQWISVQVKSIRSILYKMEWYMYIHILRIMDWW